MLAATDKIDSILDDPENGGVELVCGIEAGEWQRPHALDELKDKLDGYARFALDGEMAQRFPAFKGKRARITVVSVDPVPPLLEKWIAAIARVFAEEGLTVSTVRVQVPPAA